MFRTIPALCALLLAASVQATPESDLPTRRLEIALGQRADFQVGLQGLRLVVDLGPLQAGWYRLNENGLTHLVKMPNRPAPSDDETPLLSLWVGRDDNPAAQRFGYVATAGKYKFAINLGSREYLVRTIPAEEFNASIWSRYGSTIDEKEFAGYPDCDFVRSFDQSGVPQSIVYTLDRVDVSDVPLSLRQRFQP